ncbi:MAG: thioredoxin family protein, partial [Candidatus Ranarchaeia archaeon]
MLEVDFVTEKNWDTFISQKEPQVILCWAAWDDQSVTQKWNFEIIAKEWNGPRVHFGLINTDENVTLARELAITSVPILLFF